MKSSQIYKQSYEFEHQSLQLDTCDDSFSSIDLEVLERKLEDLPRTEKLARIASLAKKFATRI